MCALKGKASVITTWNHLRLSGPLAFLHSHCLDGSWQQDPVFYKAPPTLRNSKTIHCAEGAFPLPGAIPVPAQGWVPRSGKPMRDEGFNLLTELHPWQP